MSRVLTISIPEYTVDSCPDSPTIGEKPDKLLYDNFPGKTVVVRCVGLRDHSAMTLDELVDTIAKTGTDKYDDTRQGVADHMVPKQYRDRQWFYGEEVHIDVPEKMNKMGEIIEDFYDGAIGDRGYPIRVDVVMVYERDALERLENVYEGITASDIYVFQGSPKAALLGVVKVL